MTHRTEAARGERGRQPHMLRHKEQHPQIFGTTHACRGSSNSPYVCGLTASQWTVSKRDSCSEMFEGDVTAERGVTGVAGVSVADRA